MNARIALVILGGGLVACADEVDTTPAHYMRCSVALCGSNSPIVGHYGINDQLNLDFATNRDGFTLLGMSIGDEIFQLQITNSRLYAFDAYGNHREREDLIGAKIWLDYQGVEQFAISIEGFDVAHEVVPPYDEVETYLLEWGRIGGHLPGPLVPGEFYETLPDYFPEEPVCPEPEFWDEWTYQTSSEWNELRRGGLHFRDAVFFEGDRIDADTLTIDPMRDDRWFNIGCGAHMLAKLRLTRTTLQHVKDWRRVQATMKMFGGDYCGTGTRLTVHGEPLVWRNYETMTDYAGWPELVEARWNENGAICLGEPRLARTELSEAQQLFPDIWQDIDGDCAQLGGMPPPCSDWDPMNLEYGDEYVTSANPPWWY